MYLIKFYCQLYIIINYNTNYNNHFLNTDRVGMYNVKVNVSNPISYALANVKVFIVEGRCKAPSVFFLQSSARDMVRMVMMLAIVVVMMISDFKHFYHDTFQHVVITLCLSTA